jgi:hypothetical protein
MVLPGARRARRRVVDVERTETEKIRIGPDVDSMVENFLKGIVYV